MKSRWTWHGGGLAAAKAHFGDGTLPWLDLSTGINPYRWPGTDRIAIDWGPLPGEQALRDLEAAAAECFGTDPGHVCALPGTEIGLRLTGDLLTGSACHMVPGYRSHAEMIKGTIPVAMEDLAAADGKTLILANPNNPEGRLLGRDSLFAMLDRRGAESWLIVDEAFADTHAESSVAPDISDERRLVVFRSFGKFFGLAGLRLGFLLGPRPLLAGMRARLGAWPLSAAAIAIGTAAYRDAAWIAMMRRQLHDQAQKLDAMLAGRGFDPRGQCPLFRLIETEDAMALFEQLASQAILTRPFDYAPHWLRIGLPGSAEALARLEQALGRG